MTRPVVIVSGLGRCGSSMICQALATGGLEASGGSHPMWEDPRSNGLPKDSKWLFECSGKFVKILNPHHFTPPHTLRARVIWLDRIVNEQAKSWLKWGRETQAKLRGKRMYTARHIKTLIRQRRRAGKDVMRRVSDTNLLVLKFEEVLKYPLASMTQIKHHLEPEFQFDEEKAASVVFPRPEQCLRGFLESANIKPGALEHVNPNAVT